MKEIAALKAQLSSEFDMKDLGAAKKMIVVFILSLLIDHLHTCYMLIATKNMKEIASLKAQFSSEFDMKDLGAAKKICGMEIIRYTNYGLLYLS
jgi:hypothetical protein